MKGAASGDVSRVEQLLATEDCIINEQFNGRTALQAASQNGHIDVVHCLVKHHADLDGEVRVCALFCGKMCVYVALCIIMCMWLGTL